MDFDGEGTSIYSGDHRGRALTSRAKEFLRAAKLSELDRLPPSVVGVGRLRREEPFNSLYPMHLSVFKKKMTAERTDRPFFKNQYMCFIYF